MWVARMGLAALVALAACGSSPTEVGDDLPATPGDATIERGTAIDAGTSRECSTARGPATSSGASAVSRCLN